MCHLLRLPSLCAFSSPSFGRRCGMRNSGEHASRSGLFLMVPVLKYQPANNSSTHPSFTSATLTKQPLASMSARRHLQAQTPAASFSLRARSHPLSYALKVYLTRLAIASRISLLISLTAHALTTSSASASWLATATSHNIF